MEACRWCVGIGAHQRRRHTSWWETDDDADDDIAANVIASCVSLPLFLAARCLSLIGLPWSRDLMLYFSLSRRQLRLCCVSLLDRRSFCVCVCEYVWQQRGSWGQRTGASASAGTEVQRKLAQNARRRKQNREESRGRFRAEELITDGQRPGQTRNDKGKEAPNPNRSNRSAA